jgi:hypothetical protein
MGPLERALADRYRGGPVVHSLLENLAVKGEQDESGDAVPPKIRDLVSELERQAS